MSVYKGKGGRAGTNANACRKQQDVEVSGWSEDENSPRRVMMRGLRYFVPVAIAAVMLAAATASAADRAVLTELFTWTS
ncbi:hypothetical protein AMJ39_03285 [candidate division TA06 bacterium DG_24]|uniref:Uncharacterized protein n=2 Tax=Bacteria division TA06 TaxID=1156500 RepID=A0A0S8GDG3_UNCT6|nr:MAG: hypothetical protein AMJ39_03285 [candidate division TA06 bacterium DG_24]KPK70777.1 MAG: hypothetical protein AMJ82_02500 [candidate division TA06 bacterium SM23_40]